MVDILGEDKEFIEIVKTGKDYYNIKYLDRVTGKTHMGYSSYSLEVISQFLREKFIEQKGTNEDIVKAREVLHNIKGHDFESCGNYKLEKREAAKVTDILEKFIVNLGGKLFKEGEK